MTRWRRLVPHGSLPPGVVVGLVAVAVAAAVLGLRVLGVLEPAELAAYDASLRLRTAAGEPAPDPRILVVAVTERDIQEQGAWPLPDGLLARTLETLASLEPRAIGLDVYRDVPVPPGSADLDRVLRRERRIVAVTKFAEGSSAGIGPPPALKGTSRVGFNDIVVDAGGVVRRALLFLDDGDTVLYSLPLRLALLYLEPDGLGLGPDPADETLVRLGRTTIRPLEPREGAYAGVDARGYQFLTDYRGRRPFDRVTLGALLRGEVAREAVRDRVVLLGVTAESVKDDFYTPLGAGSGASQHVPGVEVHAHIASQLLRAAIDGQRPVGSPPEWLEWVWIALASGLGALLGYRVVAPWRLGLAVGAGLAGIVAAAHVAFLARCWWPAVPPALTWVGAAGFLVAYRSYRESVQRGTLMKLFSRHVSREVAEAIWREREQFVHGGRPQPRRVLVTALFTDLAGFTTVSERLSPEALMDWLNEYMDAMTQEISRHGGVIRQYAGDSIVAVFGVPVPRRTEAEIAADALSAVRCAVAMERRLRELNQGWRAGGRPLTGMRIGIVTGPAVAGTIGSADRSEYVVVGDTMNTASRLESFDKDVHAPDPLVRSCRILIGESTLAHVGDAFATEPVAEARLKGKEQPVAIYRVLGERTAEQTKGRSPGWAQPVVGSRPA